MVAGTSVADCETVAEAAALAVGALDAALLAVAGLTIPAPPMANGHCYWLQLGLATEVSIGGDYVAQLLVAAALPEVAEA